MKLWLFRRSLRLIRWWIGPREWELLMDEMDRGHVAVDRRGQIDFAGMRRAWTRVQDRLQREAR